MPHVIPIILPIILFMVLCILFYFYIINIYEMTNYRISMTEFLVRFFYKFVIFPVMLNVCLYIYHIFEV